MPEHHLTHLNDITLTVAERDAMRLRLRAYAIAHPAVSAAPVRAWRWALRHGTLIAGLAVLLLAGGTGVSAERSRPGDALYGFRLSVNDRIETALAFGEEAQLDTEMGQLQRMIDEEDAVRDTALSEIALADDAAREDAAEPDPEMSDDAAEPFDDAQFEEELRSIERELDEEERAQLELE